VVYNEDGTINGAKSFLVCSDQICYNTNLEKYGHTQADGTEYMIAGGMDWKYSFNELYNTKYIPFTFAEFIGTDPVEPTEVSIEHTGETASRLQLTACTVKANYTISDVFFKIKDADGKEVFSYVRRRGTFMKYDFDLSTAIPPESALSKYCDGNHTVEIYVQLGNGDKPLVYSGTFVKD
ncbi:MAG: hypothetical protein IKC69_06670, partial [Clostridia bacterium]|nr:hypothetical protein [Clostridia bacterium]